MRTDASGSADSFLLSSNSQQRTPASGDSANRSLLQLGHQTEPAGKRDLKLLREAVVSSTAASAILCSAREPPRGGGTLEEAREDVTRLRIADSKCAHTRPSVRPNTTD